MEDTTTTTTTTTTTSETNLTNKDQPMNTRHVSFSIWPPSQRTRVAVRSKMAETLSTPSSILSKRYGMMSPEEAEEAASRIEADAFDFAGVEEREEGDDGMEMLQAYSKEISKRMLQAVKGRASEVVPELENES